MKLEKTERGFSRTEFVDRYGSKCSLQKSSLATEDCVWFGVHESFVKTQNSSTRMHLTQEMVKELLPFLKRFVKTGELE
jgi:hypothetical protein